MANVVARSIISVQHTHSTAKCCILCTAYKIGIIWFGLPAVSLLTYYEITFFFYIQLRIYITCCSADLLPRYLLEEFVFFKRIPRFILILYVGITRRAQYLYIIRNNRNIIWFLISVVLNYYKTSTIQRLTVPPEHKRFLMYIIFYSLIKI